MKPERPCASCPRVIPAGVRGLRCARCRDRDYRARRAAATRHEAPVTPAVLRLPTYGANLPVDPPGAEAFADALCDGDDRWTSDSAAERASVAPCCAGCPALAACAERADLVRPRWGVWAGRDYSAGAPTGAHLTPALLTRAAS